MIVIYRKDNIAWTFLQVNKKRDTAYSEMISLLRCLMKPSEKFPIISKSIKELNMSLIILIKHWKHINRSLKRWGLHQIKIKFSKEGKAIVSKRAIWVVSNKQADVQVCVEIKTEIIWYSIKKVLDFPLNKIKQLSRMKNSWNYNQN